MAMLTMLLVIMKIRLTLKVELRPTSSKQCSYQLGRVASRTGNYGGCKALHVTFEKDTHGSVVS